MKQFQTVGIPIANHASIAQVSEWLVLLFMSAEAAVLNIYASWKAEVLFQHCATRGKHILFICADILYLTLSTANNKRNFTKQNNNKKNQELTSIQVNRSHSVIINIISPNQCSTKLTALKYISLMILEGGAAGGGFIVMVGFIASIRCHREE